MPRLKVKEIAENQGLDPAKLSRRADLAHQTVLAIFNDPHRDVNVSTLNKIATALKVPVAELIEEENHVTQP